MKMRASDYRHLAWEKLHGNWGKPILCFFLIGVVMGLVSVSYTIPVGPEADPALIAFMGFLVSVSGIITTIITGPFMISQVHIALSIADDLEYETVDIFYGFKNFLRAFLLSLINGIFIALWTLLFIIPGIIKALSYGMSFYILHDNPDMDANEARLESMKMMDGHKWELFCLGFSFIGWFLLGILTLGILFLWITPYMQVANAEFYKNLKSEFYPASDEVVDSEYTIDESEYEASNNNVNE